MGMDVKTHDFVVHHLRQAQQAIELAQRGAPAKADFGPALQLMSDTQTECGDTSEATRDPLTIGSLMKKGISALRRVNASAAGPSVAMAINHMQQIVVRLSGVDV